MKPPNARRNSSWHGIIQIVVTSRCDMRCSNCIYMVPYRKPEDITVENFERAVQSLVGYRGIVGLIGGNPCLHRQFPELCEIMRIVPRRQRGLWTNRLFGHGKLVAETFGFLNLNCHGNQKAADEMHRDLSGTKVFGERDPCIHGAVMVSMVELNISESERWRAVACCDVNQNWSPAIVQLDGEIEAYACEVASSFAVVTGPRCGLAVTPGWWRKPMREFSHQVEMLCHDCGVPLRLRGHEDQAQTDDVSMRYLPLLRRCPGRKSVVVTETSRPVRELTDYQRLRSER